MSIDWEAAEQWRREACEAEVAPGLRCDRWGAETDYGRLCPTHREEVYAEIEADNYRKLLSEWGGAYE